MRRVQLGSTGIETSCIGFGCASLGSRVEAREGLRAIEAAIDRGVSWIDVAPTYGNGEAEAILAPLLARRRAALQICTKVGIAPPPAAGGLRALVTPAARRLVAAFPALRAALRRSGLQAARPLPLTPALIRGSLEASLRRLGTDHVDLYALHDADPAALAREPVLRALEDILARGEARAVAVASDPAAVEAALAVGAPYGVAQFPLPPPGAPTCLLARVRAAGLGCITHSVFGVEGALARLGRRLGDDPRLRAAALDGAGIGDGGPGDGGSGAGGAGDGGVEAALARLLLGRAFRLNPTGVVLVSMFSTRSREQNLAVAAAPPPEDAVALIDRLAARQGAAAVPADPPPRRRRRVGRPQAS